MLYVNSSTLAWKIPWTEETGRLQPMGSLRVEHDWAPSLSPFTFMHWRRKWQPTPVFLLGESQGRGSLVGCRLWGRRVGHDWSDLAVAVCVQSLSRVWLFAAPGTAGCQLLCPGDSPGKNPGVGCHALLQGIFWTQGSNSCLLNLLHWQEFFTTSATWEALIKIGKEERKRA